MSSSSPVTLSVNQANLDGYLKEYKLFSRRVVNALMRQGIITPRLLIMHTPEMLCRIGNLGPKGLDEIECILASQGWDLAKDADEKLVVMTRLIATAFYKVNQPLSLSALTKKVNQFSRNTWNESDIAEVATIHPYLEVVGTQHYQFYVRPIDAPFQIAPLQSTSTPSQEIVNTKEKIILSKLWPIWLSALDEKLQEVLILYYGIDGDESRNLQEVGNELSITRERVRQLKNKALRVLSNSVKPPHWQPLFRLLAESVKEHHGLLSIDQWERWLDNNTIWECDAPRPSLLQFLSDLSDEFHYLSGYNVATFAHISDEHLNELNRVVKSILRQHMTTGLTLDELIPEILSRLSPHVDSDIANQHFLLSSFKLFDRIELREDGRVFYLKKKAKSRYPTSVSDWLGKPGTQLYEWELRLREQFTKIAWIGHLQLTEDDFLAMCHAVQEEAQDRNYFSKVLEGQPRLVPAAVFITTMVLSARYIKQDLKGEADEFWHPYLRTVWGVEYTQSFYARCKKRFNAIVPFLEENYRLEFPRVGKAQSDVITPIYRHALIPRYMQNDFAKWLCGHWRNIMVVAETPTTLATQLQTEPSLDLYYSSRLKHFIRDTTTAETATSLITSMATAISMHIDDGESIEAVSDLLADSPIEHELWHEIAKELVPQRVTLVSSPRVSRPRVTWVWSLDEGELCLRVQNIILPAETKLQGEPDRLVWLEEADSDPLAAEIEVDVIPWRMKTGELIIQDVFLFEPDGPIKGVLVLLTDMDEVAICLDIPPHPTTAIQFYRITQQGAYGIPVDTSNVNDGEVLVCAEQPLLFLDEDDEVIEPNGVFHVPYPLTDRYRWAAQLTLSLPVTIQCEGKEAITLEQKGGQPSFGEASLCGTKLIAGLSHQVQPTFTNTEICLKIEFGGERLLKQTLLWIHGQDGWRWQQSLAELYLKGQVSLIGDSLSVDFSEFIPAHPNFYTVELRSSLQPILPVPLQFAIVPNLTVEMPSDKQLYTPVKPFQVTLDGVDDSVLVRRKGMTINILPDGRQQIAWNDLRHEPKLMLRFDTVNIPLAWSVPRFMAWLEPKPIKPFLSLDEVYKTTLHVISAHTDTNTFTLSDSDQHYRSFSLKRGRSAVKLGHSQLYDMVRLSQDQCTQIKMRVESDIWDLFEVRQRPELLWVKVEYDEQEQIIIFQTGLQGKWVGNVRFVAESLTNPFASIVEMAQTKELKDVHILPAPLAAGVYLVRLELDNVWIPLNEKSMCVTIGEIVDDAGQSQQLITEIRNGQLISPELAEDFVLWWVEMAEAGETTLLPTTLYQLATVPARALENFIPQHLEPLWHTLATLRTVHNRQPWIESYGLLPAWIFLLNPIFFKTLDHGFRLRVYPMQVMQQGRMGKGYARWRMSTAESAPKELVYVEWKAVSDTNIQIKAGLLDNMPTAWTNIDIDDMFGLYYCPRCGRLTAARGHYELPDEITRTHLHGHSSASLGEINLPEEYGGYRLLTELFHERRGPLLTDIYQEFEILYPSASAYLPEPPLPTAYLFNHPTLSGQLVTLTREIISYGRSSEDASPWASAFRLLSRWNNEKNISQLGQAVIAFGMLLRTAAYQRRKFQKLCHIASLSIDDVQNLLAELNKTAPAHLEWGLTWAELLILHSPYQIHIGNDE